MPARRVLSVGQCHADHGSIFHMLRQHFGAEVVPAASAEEALDLVRRQRFDLVLVNRVLDADGSSGVDLVGQMRQEKEEQPIMLVSNYEDAQNEAVTRGALPGFGKGSLGHPPMLARLQAVLGEPETVRHGTIGS